MREGNSGDIAHAINKLHANPALARHMGRTGREQVEALYTWKRVAERMRDIYLKVTQRHPALATA